MPNIHLIIPTTTQFQFAEGLRKKFAAFENLKITESWITEGPASIESEFDELLAGPATVIEAMRVERETDADAIVIICMGDPALMQTREAVSIPVFGIGETAMHYAAMFGYKFSVLPTKERRRSTYEHHAHLYGLGDKLASVRPTGIPVLDIDESFDKTFAVLMDRASAAIEQDHADVIVLGCGCFKDLDRKMEAALREKFGQYIPVIDAVPLTVLSALAAVSCDLRHSKRAYDFPPEKIFKGIPKLHGTEENGGIKPAFIKNRL